MGKRIWTELEITDAIEAVKQWQENEQIHPLTCGNDSNHPILIPWEVEGRVLLACTECDWIQAVPQIILDSYKQSQEK